MSSPVAVEGCTIEVLPPAAGGMVAVQTPASRKAKADGKGIYLGAVAVVVSGCALGSYAQTAPALITIQPSVLKKLKVEGKTPLAPGDGGTALSPSVFAGSGSSVSAKISVRITDAGQSKVLGD